MISTSGVGLVLTSRDEQASLSNENLTLIAHLFASMTCADDKIKDIENFTAETFLEDYRTEDIQRIKQAYRDSLKNYGDEERKQIVKSLVGEFTEQQKIGLLRSLSAVAICDGEVHPEEQHIIKLFMEQMEIDQFVDN